MKTKNRLRITLNIDKDIIKTIKLLALNRNSTQTEIINYYLKKGLESEDTKNKIPEYLIANKKTYNPDKTRKKKMAGIIKVKEPFDVVEMINFSRTGK
jgi:hypothetical protein